MGRPAWIAALALASVLAACSDDATPPPPADSGVDAADTGPAPLTPTAPEDPAAPTLGPCPTGWREVPIEASIASCDPWPMRGVDTCAAHQAHFVGEELCTTVGGACPSGDYADDLPLTGRVFYVLASAAAGGDGSVTTPFDTISAALAVAGDGDVVAVGRGTYDEVVRPRAGVTLWGACAEATVLTVSAPSTTEGVVDTGPGAVTIKNVTIGASPRFGVHVGRNAELTLEGVVVDGATITGIYIDGGGILDAHALVVRNTAATTDGQYGRGINVSDGEATVTRAVIEDNLDLGLYAGGAGTTLTLADVAVRGTRSQPTDGLGGRALEAGDGASVDIQRVIFEDNRDVTLALTGADTFVHASQLVIRDSGPRDSDGMRGRAINIQSGARAELSQLLVERSGATAIFASGEGARLTLADAVVRDTLGDPAIGSFGNGIIVRESATADIVRTYIARSRAVGLFVSTGAMVDAQDIVVIDTEADAVSGFFGRSIGIEGGASLTLARATLSNSRDFGIIVFGSSLVAEDVAIRGVTGQEALGKYGRGIEVDDGGSAMVTRLVVEDTRDYAIGALGAGATFEGSEIRLARTRPAVCAASGCAAEGGGTAIVAGLGGATNVRRFVVEDADLCGALVAEGSELDLAFGDVSGCAIGVCIQVDGYALDRVNEGVTFHDNGTNLDSTTLPVPVQGESAPEPPM